MKHTKRWLFLCLCGALLCSLSILPAQATEHTDAPEAVFEATDVDRGKLSNVNSTMQYSTDSETWITCKDETMTLKNLSEGSLEIAYIDNPEAVQTIEIGRQDAPGALTVKNCTKKSNNNGKIIGTDKTMEYRHKSAKKYQSCWPGTTENLKSGVYYVRSKADGCYLASGNVKVKVGAYKAKLPVITQQPKAKSAPTGKDVVFSIKAENAKSYEWHVIDIKTKKDYVLDPTEDKIYYKGIGTNELTVLSINKSKTGETDCTYDGDRYYCIVSNSVGTVCSDTVRQTVTHKAKKGWKYDSTFHWNTCVCGTVMNKTKHVDKNKDGKCDVCGAEKSLVEYKIVVGSDSTWTIGTTMPLTLASDGALKKFTEIRIDDKTVDPKYYRTEEYSKTVINLAPSYLNKLDVDIHSISLIFKDGYVITPLYVIKDTTEKTSVDIESVDTEPEETDTAPAQEEGIPFYAWILGAIAVIAIVLAIVLGVKLKKSKE